MVTEQDPRWHLLGDNNADGQFLYGVITTGIYCRPGCPSRRPNPDNVRFFDNAKVAETAGFRPCKRCHPQHASSQALEIERVTALCRYIEKAAHQPDLAELANYSGWSSSHLQRVFKKVTGVSPKTYTKQIHQQRLQKESAIGIKFTKGKTMHIEYAISLSSLGNILVAWSVKGICAILIDDDSTFLIKDLQQRFRQADLIRSDKKREQELQKIIAFIERPKKIPDLPLDIQGTLFQQRVWQALQQIPAGETRSYTEIATAIGSPKSVRAVAGACAANAIAVIIPCHRVVRQDGNLSGYRWGIERKEALLKKEAKDNP
jgi:AraC family transcriptional regulator of adaptative response/methylated-DNA-[protein]-cysteine methyltransferase